jgi:hypothetical protein
MSPTKRRNGLVASLIKACLQHKVSVLLVTTDSMAESIQIQIGDKPLTSHHKNSVFNALIKTLADEKMRELSQQLKKLAGAPLGLASRENKKVCRRQIMVANGKRSKVIEVESCPQNGNGGERFKIFFEPAEQSPYLLRV